MKDNQTNPISEKAKQLGFVEHETGNFKYDLPFGESTVLLWNSHNSKMAIYKKGHAEMVNIRIVNSPEEFEELFNGIVPEKYVLPFFN
jgi:hypothetical protein